MNLISLGTTPLRPMIHPRFMDGQFLNRIMQNPPGKGGYDHQNGSSKNGMSD